MLVPYFSELHALILSRSALHVHGNGSLGPIHRAKLVKYGMATKKNLLIYLNGGIN